MRFLFTCGGTAGHINPAIAVASRLKELLPDSKFLFVGAEGKMETELVPREGYNIETIKITNLQRKLSIKGIAHNMRSLANVLTSRGRARRIISNFKPDCAIGTGGYVCYPVLRASSRMGVPSLVHESNAVPGLTTKMLEKYVSKVMVGFKGVESEYRNPQKVIYTGTPVKEQFLKLDRVKARRELGYSPDRPIVVSFWGSLGASGMNDVMEEFIELNSKSGSFYHIHATGGGESGCKSFLDKLSGRGVKLSEGGNCDIRPYIYDMPKVMAMADVVLCRAGASTLNELIAMSKPAILVPSPYVTNNHQEENAMVLKKAGGVKIIKENECTGKMLFDEVSGLIADKKDLENMEKNLKKLRIPDATDKIAEIILDLMKS